MKRKAPRTLAEKYLPSPDCGCEICVHFCRRPGWWTVAQARCAMQEGLGTRMMLEVSPEFDFGVLSPAFRGCEGSSALAEFSVAGCTFLSGGLCELHNSPHMPLECRFCDHSASARARAATTNSCKTGAHRAGKRSLASG